MTEEHFESYYVPDDEINGPQFRIRDEEFRHLAKVKRKRPGDSIHVSDGVGTLYTVTILEVKATYATVEIVKARRLVGELLTRITLAQGLIRSQRMDWVIEKGTELGVSCFVPVYTRYSLSTASELKHKRWNRLARAAMKQCGRSILPEIKPVINVEELAENLPRPVLFAHPGTQDRVQDVFNRIRQNQKDPLQAVTLLVGPEGGFSDEEVALFRELNFHQVTLGERRLRSETAAVALIALTLEALQEM